MFTANNPAPRARTQWLGIDPSTWRGGRRPSSSGLAAQSKCFRAASGRKSARAAPTAGAVGFAICAGLCDMAAVVGAVGGLTSFVGGALIGGRTLLTGGLIATLVVLPCAALGEYGVSTYVRFQGHVMRTVFVWNLAFFYLLAIALATDSPFLAASRAWAAFYFVGCVALVATRMLLVVAIRSQAAMGRLPRRALFLVGFEKEIEAYREQIGSALPHIQVAGAFVLRGNIHLGNDLTLAAASARLIRPDEVVIVAPWTRRRVIRSCIDAFRCVPASICLAPDDVIASVAGDTGVFNSRFSTIELARAPLSNLEAVLKRSIDVVGAAIGLVLLAPIFVIAALLIKLDSPGPVMFSQLRYGFNLEPFRIYKFRSLTVLEEGRSVTQVCRDDARVTNVGRWLRRSNIDELPQLFNVFRGDMSLVGPRPHALVHEQEFGRSIAAYARRHNMKPGITGWAQANGLRGEIRSEADIRQRIEHDLYYIENWSLWLDWRCLWRTVASSRAWRNAY